MKITKLGHSCLLVEMPDRTALFDPGVWSEVNVESLAYLDDIIITHEHADHMDVDLIKRLVGKFPKVRIKAASTVTGQLNEAGLQDNTLQDPDEGVVVFNAPHEALEPMGHTPENMGVHYLDKLTHPGDCVHFDTTMPILALPITAPWGSVVAAFALAVQLKPTYVLPIHDWHWSDQARADMYDSLEARFGEEGITFMKLKNGEPVVIKDV